MHERYAVNIGPGEWLGLRWYRPVPFTRARIYVRKHDADSACAEYCLGHKHGASVFTVKVSQ